MGCQNLTYLLECRVDLLDRVGRVLSRFDCWDLGRFLLNALLLDLLDLLPDVALKQGPLERVIVLHFLEYITHLRDNQLFPVKPFNLGLDPRTRNIVRLLGLLVHGVLVRDLGLAGVGALLRVRGRLVRLQKVLHHRVGVAKDLSQVNVTVHELQGSSVVVLLTGTVTVLLHFLLPVDLLQNFLLLLVVGLDLHKPCELRSVDRLVAVRVLDFIHGRIVNLIAVLPVVERLLLPKLDIADLFLVFEVLLLLHVGGQLLGLVLVEHRGGDVVLPVRLGLRLVHVDMQVLLANVYVARLLMVAGSGVFRLLFDLTLSLEPVTKISEQLRLLQILRLLLRLGRDLVLEAGDRVGVLLLLVLLGGALDHLVKLHPQLLSDVLGELLI